GGLVLLALAGGTTLTVNAGNISSNDGEIRFFADDATITGTVNAGSSGAVEFFTVTSGQPVDLGGAGSGARLALTDAELDNITAGLLRIDATTGGSTGNITVTAPIDSEGSYPTLSLISLGDVTETGTGFLAGNGVNLSVAALGNIVTLDNANNRIVTVAGK